MTHYKSILIGIALIFILSATAFVSKQKAYKATDGFSASSIQFDIPFNSKWETNPLSQNQQKELEQILQYKFSYLAKGARSYAFISDDGKYVLKFFKYRYHIPHWTVRYLPSIPPFNYLIKKKANKVSLDTVLSGYKNAYEHDPEGTGMLYIHLNPKEKKLPKITVIDKVKQPHIINLNHTRFVLQRKAKEFSEILDELLKENNITLAKRRINKVIDLYLSHYRKGLYDLGTGIIRNNGFIGDDPIHFDVGKLTFNEEIRNSELQQKAFALLLENANEWFVKNYPRHRQEIMQDIENKLNQVFEKEDHSDVKSG